jgi:CBS domain-containing protein
MPERSIASLVRPGPVDHIDAGSLVIDAVRYMARVRRGAVPVIEDGRLVGMFSERDLMLRVVLAGKDPHAVKVSEVMTRDLVVARRDDTHAGCLAKMKKMHFRHLPVVDEGRLVGLISLRDLLEMETAQQSEQIEMLSYYVHYRPDQDNR